MDGRTDLIWEQGALSNKLLSDNPLVPSVARATSFEILLDISKTNRFQDIAKLAGFGHEHCGIVVNSICHC